MEVRRLGPEDAGLALSAIHLLKRPESQSTFSADYMCRFLSRPENLLIVASDKAECLGFLVAYALDRVDRDQRMICLYEIGVSELHRRRGIGRAMIEVLKGICRDTDAMKTWVITNRSNREAVALYESAGAESEPSGDEVVFVWGAENSRGCITRG